MSYHVSTFALGSAFAAWGASLVAMLAWLRRDLTPGARSLFWLMLAIAGHTGRVLVLHDVTDRYRAEGELRDANHKLAEQLADLFAAADLALYAAKAAGRDRVVTAQWS